MNFYNLSLNPVVLYGLIAAAIIIIAIVIVCLIKHSKRKKELAAEQQIIDGYYVNIIEAVGSIDNILNVENVGSRLSFYLKDQSLLQVDKLKEINITGIVKTSKKVTLVVGEMAAKYSTSIKAEIEKRG